MCWMPGQDKARHKSQRSMSKAIYVYVAKATFESCSLQLLRTQSATWHMTRIAREWGRGEGAKADCTNGIISVQLSARTRGKGQVAKGKGQRQDSRRCLSLWQLQIQHETMASAGQKRAGHVCQLRGWAKQFNCNSMNATTVGNVLCILRVRCGAV